MHKHIGIDFLLNDVLAKDEMISYKFEIISIYERRDVISFEFSAEVIHNAQVLRVFNTFFQCANCLFTYNSFGIETDFPYFCLQPHFLR